MKNVVWALLSVRSLSEFFQKTLVFLALLPTVTLNAFDWKHQSCSELRRDMLSFAQDFAGMAKGTPEGRVLRKFIKAENRKAPEDTLSWIMDTYELVQKLESLCPPTEDDGSFEAQVRKNTMLLLDFPIHVDNTAPSASEQEKAAFDAFSKRYLADARRKALDWLASPAPAPGELQVCEFYNMSCLLRTSSRTLAIDVRWDGTAEEAFEIARKSDIFFLSHPHLDHYNPAMLEALGKAGAAMVLPSDVFPEYSGMDKIVVDAPWDQPVSVRGVDVQIVRGDQGKGFPNNAYLLSFDGWKVLLPGENEHPELYAPLKGFPAPDLILFPSWNGLDRMLGIVRQMPGHVDGGTVCVPGHENEILFHGINHRESYRELFQRPDRLGSDAVKKGFKVMLEDLGEHLTLKK
ncbi:MAG: hypothetical protein MJY84_07005 [Bacteroidales bacterium]|nr:hypothetical protein [Bacteroidales bacterium]